MQAMTAKKTGVIGRIAMLVEIDGELCHVALKQPELRTLVTLAASMSSTGNLPVTKGDGRLTFDKPEDWTVVEPDAATNAD